MTSATDSDIRRGCSGLFAALIPRNRPARYPPDRSMPEATMGFMDKAKKLAEQAQQKLDEAQQNFKEGGSTPGQAGARRYDAHGRPVEDGPPAGSAPPPSGEPAPPAPEAPAAPEPPAPDPAAASAATEPTAPEPPAPAPPPSEGSTGSANATPDPFKPLQQ